MVGPKKQDFRPNINILKGNQCILIIQGARSVSSSKIGHDFRKIEVRKKCFLQKMVS